MECQSGTCGLVLNELVSDNTHVPVESIQVEQPGNCAGMFDGMKGWYPVNQANI